MAHETITYLLASIEHRWLGPTSSEFEAQVSSIAASRPASLKWSSLNEILGLTDDAETSYSFGRLNCAFGYGKISKHTNSDILK
jgi:hypothetical protein